MKNLLKMMLVIALFAISSQAMAPATARVILTATDGWLIPQEREDGKWVFPYVGDERVAQYPPDLANYFDTTFPHVKEEYDASWFPVSEDIGL